MPNNLAPIILFVYNRPWHTEQTINALLKNELVAQSDLIIYSDGAKNESDCENVNIVRSYIQTISGFNSIRIIKRSTNFGLGYNIIDGVTSVVNEFGSVIVLEDDLITSPFFLKYMNEALKKYAIIPAVISIHSYIYPVNKKLPETFFIKGADCLGWGTWKDKWALFESDGSKLLNYIEEKGLSAEFDFNHAYQYTLMLRDQIAGKNSSWAVRWYASAFIHNMLTLYPGRSLVFHSGNDGSGTNFGTSAFLDVELSEIPVEVRTIKVEENALVRKHIERYLKYRNTDSIIIVYRNLKHYLKLQFENYNLKHKIKRFIPPIIPDIIRGLNKSDFGMNSGWFGNYATWDEAKAECNGYDHKLILDKVIESLLKVRNGEAIYERDSVLFDKIQYSWPLLSWLLRAVLENNNMLNVLDFGGSLGSSYYQNKEFLSGIKEFKWNIVEQTHFVDTGRNYFQNETLRFYNSIEECLKINNCNVLLLSAVLQYLDSPIDFLKRVVSYNIEYIIIDRTAFIKGNENRITIQHVPPEIYDATYPSWFFNEKELLKPFDKVYRQVACFDALDKSNIPDSYFKGFIYKRN